MHDAMKQAAGWLGAVLLVAVGIEAVATPVAVASEPSDERVMPLVWDLGGASGTLDAIALNPAAAAGLPRTFMSVRMAAPRHGTDPGLPAYTLALMDAGGRLTGGLVGRLEAAPDADRDWALSYTLAGKLGAGAAGARVTWTRVPDGDGSAHNLWYVDAGLVAQLGPMLRVGLAAYRLKLHDDSWPGAKPGARVGLTLSAPSPGGWLVGAGLANDDLTRMGSGQTLEAGVLLPLGRRVHVSASYRQPLGGAGTGDGGSVVATWGAGVSLEVTPLRLELGYQSDGVYQVGLRADV